MDLTFLEAIEIATQETKEYIDEQCSDIQSDHALTMSEMKEDVKAVSDALTNKQDVGDYALKSEVQEVSNSVFKKVSTVNGIAPDENGNVLILPAVTEDDNGVVLAVNDGEWNKVNFPITVSDDGYTEVANQRKILHVQSTKAADKINVIVTLEGDKKVVMDIGYNENNYPKSLILNGHNVIFDWNGF